ncbi:hypothetical protein NH340_JMT00696 [Sarcoptes scabiei]|nr:hypothetical protein NH340_JMT00696 [Sarcoptes scabiei]
MNDRVVIGCSISAIAVVLISIWVWNSKYNHNNSRKKQPKSDPKSKQLSNAQNSRPLASSIPNSAMENKMISSNDQCEEKDSIKKNLSSDTSERSTKENVAESDEIQNDDISDLFGLQQDEVFNSTEADSVVDQDTDRAKLSSDSEDAVNSTPKNIQGERELSSSLKRSKNIVSSLENAMKKIEIDLKPKTESSKYEKESRSFNSPQSKTNVNSINIKANDRNYSKMSIKAKKSYDSHLISSSIDSSSEQSRIRPISPESPIVQTTSRQTFAQIVSGRDNSKDCRKTIDFSLESNLCQNKSHRNKNLQDNLNDDFPVLIAQPASSLNSIDGNQNLNNSIQSNDLSDNQSQSSNSNDSGKGSCSNDLVSIKLNDSPSNDDSIASNDQHQVNNNYITVHHKFKVPQSLCGLLIGRNGRNINPIKSATNTQILIQSINEKSSICSIIGFEANVLKALNMINEKLHAHSEVDVFNSVELCPTIPLSEKIQLKLSEDIDNDVTISCLINAGHFFLQQPLHPSFPKLEALNVSMKDFYSSLSTPSIAKIFPGLICTAPSYHGWYRVVILNVDEQNNTCDFKYVDYGGFCYNFPSDYIRQIRQEFLLLPFQAIECYMARVAPINQIGWTQQATEFLDQLIKNQVIYARVHSYANDKIPLVNLYHRESRDNSIIDINLKMVEQGYAKLIEDSISNQTM